ncbi:MAG TPA: NAD(P)H-hydrate dehydratase [Burkholderiaceae bacterium]|nr:NAD(P)H-hydrate dehydratase [Burkholderiaceae bacterium]
MLDASRPRSPLPLHGIAASRAIEQQAQAALPAHTLMRRAGAAVARLALAVAPHAQRVWIAAGPGNNGGDGLEAAIGLLAAGRAVRVALVGDAAALPPDAADALRRAQDAGVEIGATGAPRLERHDLAIDALLGLGASRAPRDALAATIGAFDALACTVLAVDVPSGLHCETGQPLGEVCVRAAHTLALLTLKPGLFTGLGRDLAGYVWFDDLGVAGGAQAPGAWLTGTDAARALRAPRRHAQHKGSFGDLAVVGGAAGMTGAAVLAARAAHAAGAGRVYVDLLDGAAPDLDFARPELMFRRAWWQGERAVIGAATVVCGCGGGDAAREALPRLSSLADRLVLDADALNAIASDEALQTQLAARAARGQATVLTPHPLEAARLSGASAREVQADRLRAAQTLAERFRCVVLLKGSGSIVAAPGRVPQINPTGNASLATAGTGDVLAGWLGGLWAQSGHGESPFEIAAAAACAHGAAADGTAVAPLRAADLIEAMLRDANAAARAA